MKTYICDKLASSVNNVKYSNVSLVSEFINEEYDKIDRTIFDFAVT